MKILHVSPLFYPALAYGGPIRALFDPTAPKVFLSTHRRQLPVECCRALRELGYTLRPETGDDLEACSELVGHG